MGGGILQVARWKAMFWGWRLGAALVGAILVPAAVRAQEEPAPLPLPVPPLPGFEAKQEPRIVLQPPRPVDPLDQPVPFPKLDPAVILPDGSSVTLPETTKQIIRFAPRYGRLNDYVIDPIGEDIQRLTYSGGLIVNVIYLPDRPGDKPQEVEFATDNAVAWIKGAKKGTDIIGGLRTEKAKPNEKADGKISVELYLSGNVVIRSMNSGGQQGATEQTLRAEEVYYDLDKSKAIAMNADLETRFQFGYDPIRVRGREIWRLGQHEWRAFDTLILSSKRPADPALTIKSREVSITDETTVRRNIFGQPYRDARTGEIDVSTERMLTAENNRTELFGIPIFVWPKYRAALDDPGGPLSGIGVRNDNIFGFQTYTSWDLYKLMALRGPPNSRWVLNLDYLSLRGPGVGSNFDYNNLFGDEHPNQGGVLAYYISDKGADNVGGLRGPYVGHGPNRGRFNWNHTQELFEEGTSYAKFMGQAAYQSDMNFYEQYYKLRFDQDPNQETFGYVYGAQGNTALSALAQVNVNRPWMTETQWLPKGDAALIGQSLLQDKLVYTARANVGYAKFLPATQGNLSTLPTESSADGTIRAGLNQRLSLPFDLGPLRLEPYGMADTTYYSQDLNGASIGRVTGAAGIEAMIPFSRLYSDVKSEAFNVRGLYHKVEYGVNYYLAGSNISSQQLPLLDRLNDDSIDFTSRTFRQNGQQFIPGPNGVALTTDPLFDPQLVAIRRVVDTKSETLDTMQVVQGEIRNRWQTKRGLPGSDHTVDYIGLDLSASYFPNPTRDNFGSSLAFLEYNAFWNIGDRTAITSSAWVDPIDPAGAHYFNLNAIFSRPDGTNFTLGYRQTNPLGSKALLAILSYQLSQKYSVGIAAVYDFGTNQSQTTSFNFSRTGTDITVSVGFSYNALVNNFGLQLLILPNAAAPKLVRNTGMYQ
jgi:hypothetical protein